MEYKYDRLYLTEKDSQVESLAPVVGCEHTRNWYPAYSKDKKTVVVPLQGHLTKLIQPAEYDPAFKDWNEETMYCFPKEFKLKVAEGKEEMYNRAIQHLRESKEIIIATDFDNEGAALAMRIIEKAGVEDRVKFMLDMGSVNKEALKNALENPKNIPYRTMANAGYLRAYIDFAEGYSFSRALTLLLAKKKVVLNFGGVKTPLAKIVVDRDLQFESHNSIKYYTLNGLAKAKDKEFEFSVFQKVTEDGKSKKNKQFDKESVAENIKNKILELTNTEVSFFEKKRKKEGPPQLFELTRLQAEASKKLNLDPSKTLEIGQELYIGDKVSTYIRSAIPYLKKEEFKDVPKILTNISEIMHKEIIDEILSKTIPMRKEVFDSSKVTSHGAVCPTTERVKNLYDKFPKLKQDLYNIIATRYIMNFMDDYEYGDVQGEALLYDDFYIAFSEKIPLKAGFKKLEDDDIDKKIKEFKRSIPDLEVKDKVEIVSLQIKEGETKPKPRFTMDNILMAMENIANLYPDDPIIKEQLGEHGIGTPATRTKILEAMFKEENGTEPWFIRKGKQIISTEKARKFINVLPEEITSPLKRALLTAQIKEVEKGNKKIEEVLDNYRDTVKDTIELIREYSKNPDNIFLGSSKGKEVQSLGTCPVCGKGEIYEKGKVFLCTNAKWKKEEKDGKEEWSNEGCDYKIFKTACEKFGKNELSALDIKGLLKNGKKLVTLKSERTKGTYEKYIIPDSKWGIKVDFTMEVPRNDKAK
jgi:DNA topoisomerase-3